MWPNFGKINSNSYEDLFSRFSGHCLLWPWPLSFGFWRPKSNQYICQPRCMCDQHWIKFRSLVFEIWCSRGFRDAQTHRLTHRRTDPKTECLQYQRRKHKIFSSQPNSQSGEENWLSPLLATTFLYLHQIAHWNLHPWGHQLCISCC